MSQCPPDRAFALPRALFGPTKIHPTLAKWHLLTVGATSMANSQQKRAVVIDDERVIADMFADVLKLNGYEAAAAYSGKEGIERALQSRPQVVISDISMPGINGVESAQAIHRALPECKFLFLSGLVKAEELVRDSEIADSKVLMKPVPPEAILASLSELLA